MIYIRELCAGLVSPLVVNSKQRFAAQLQKFAYTEFYTYFDIGAVAARQEEPELRAEMERHARDEYRHYHVFKDWARQLEPYVEANYGDPDDVAPLDDSSVQWASEQSAAPNQRLRSLGEYMMYLTLSESRAAFQFKLYQWINFYHAGLHKFLPPVLADESRHVRYSLKHAWREARKAPWKSFKGLLRVLGYILHQDAIDLLKTISTVGSAVMTRVLYYVIATPYALVMRLFGALRRGRIRKWRPLGPARLDAAFWKRSG